MKKISIKSILNRSWEGFKKHWKLLLSIGLLITLVSFITSIELNSPRYYSFSELLLQVIGGLLSIFLSLGFIRLLINLVSGVSVKFEDIFKGVSVKLFLSFLAVGILYGIIVGLGFIALIIPGLILMTGLFMAQYLVADERAKIIESFKQSWEMTKGNRWRILGFLIIAGIISILGAITLVGMIVIIPFVSLASVYLYKDLLGEDTVDIIVEEEIIEIVEESDTEDSQEEKITA